MLGHQIAQIYGRKTKMNMVQETHPIRVNARYEINWTNIFFQNVRETSLQTDGQTVRTDGQYTPSTLVDGV